MNNALPESSLYSITEASRILGVSPTTLRRWEDEGRLTPARTPGGDRRFSPEDIKNILQSFRKETYQLLNTEVETLPPLPPKPDLVTPPPPPLIPIRQIENYRPRRPRPYFHLALALTFLLTGYIFFSSIPLLTKMRLERAFSPGPANPIVDVNDALEYRISESGELRLGFKFPVDIGVLFTKSLNVAEDAILNTARFLGTVFFGNGDDYFISPTGDASFNSVNSGTISVTSLNVENLTVTGTTTGVTGTGGGGGLATGGDADTLEGQGGSYYLDLGNEIGTCANCLTTAEIAESTLSIGAANPDPTPDTLDFLDSPQLPRSDTNDSFIAGTLTFNGGTTLDLQGTILNSTGSVTFSDDVDILGDLMVSGLTIANGDVTLGDTAADTITFTGVVCSALLPSPAWDFGSAALRWDTGYFDTIDATFIAGTITGSGTNANSLTVNQNNLTPTAQTPTP